MPNINTKFQYTEIKVGCCRGANAQLIISIKLMTGNFECAKILCNSSYLLVGINYQSKKVYKINILK